jgi:hypothetical protein
LLSGVNVTQFATAEIGALAAAPGITSVLMRLGTSPTGTTAISFIARVSMTDTRLSSE